MKIFKYIKYPLVCAFLLRASVAVAASEKPNVLFIFADDMSYETIGAYGMIDIDTPHLDTLAESGTTFTNAYNMGAWNGAVCVASRNMLNTGRSIWNAKKLDSKPALAEKAAKGEFWSQRMKAAGYRTYMTGKWHVKVDAGMVFDDARHVRAGMPDQTAAGYNRPEDEEGYTNGWKPWDPQYGGFWEGGKHWSEVLADDSVAFLEDAAKREEPFFMYLAFNAAHDPRQAPKEYVDRYPLSRIQMPENFLSEYPDAEAICGKNLRDERLIPYPRTEYSVKVNRQEYFALITHMDDQIGRILDALEATGQADNTYIVFTADHGLAVGHHGLVGKQNMYDHSVRVPFMVVGPDLKAGMKLDTPIYLQDVMPTSLELAGASVSDADFKSLLPLLHNKTDQHYDVISCAYIGTQRMVMQDEWKLIAYPLIKTFKLFNLKKDPFEKTDLGSNPEYQAVKENMLKLLEAEMDALGDPMSSLEAADYENPNVVIQHGPGE